MATERQISRRTTPSLVSGLRLCSLTALLLLAGCASVSSVDKVRAELQATEGRAAQIEAQNVALGREMQSLRSSVAAQSHALETAQAKLIVVVQKAITTSRTALRLAKQANENVANNLGPLAHQPTSDGKRHLHWLFARVVAQARALATKPYAPPPRISAVLRHLGGARFRSLRFRATPPFWPLQTRIGLGFQPVGSLFDHAMNVYLVVGRSLDPVTFSAADFGLPTSLAKVLPTRIAPSGFEIVRRNVGKDRGHAYFSLQDANYFRGRGHGQGWGALAYALTINTAVRNQPESIPAFRSFWIVPPGRKSRALTFFGLLDGPAVTGAYRFRVLTGTVTRVRITEVLFLRHPVTRFELAPLATMFLRGRIDARRPLGMAPAVHDSDGLSYETPAGHWVWSPLVDPTRLTIRTFRLTNPRGFGFQQRDRRFKAYQSVRTHYQACPNVWVVPHDAWGAGRLELVEIPMKHATDDNIMAFWVPAHPPLPGHPFTLRYSLRWGAKGTPSIPLARVTTTRGVRAPHGYRTFVVDFQGSRLSSIPSWVALKPSVVVRGHGSVRDVSLVKRPKTHLWQLRFSATDHPGLVLKAWIYYRTRVLTEIWTYQAPR